MDKGYFDLPTSVGKCLSIMICIRMQFHLRTRNQSSFRLWCNKTNAHFSLSKILPSKRKLVFVDELRVKVSVQGRSLQNNWNGPLDSRHKRRHISGRIVRLTITQLHKEPIIIIWTDILHLLMSYSFYLRIINLPLKKSLRSFFTSPLNAIDSLKSKWTIAE